MPEFYDALERRTKEAREAALLAALQAQLQHAKSNAPAYAESLQDYNVSDLKHLDDLSAYPLTRKSELITRQAASRPFGGLTAYPQGQLKYIFSSPGPIYEPQTHREDYWRFSRALFAAGFRKDDLVHNCFSYHLTPAGAMADSGCHALGCAVIPAGVGQTELQVQTIHDLKPTAYIGTPSFLRIILEKADALGVDVSSINKALVSGEAFPSSTRDFFKARGIQASQCYATADLGLIAYESTADSGLILDEGVHVEIVRPGTGDLLADGEVGEVVVTTLNPDYPLIRFATGDLSAILQGDSPCGRTNRRIKGWLGRADQTAKVRGMFIHPEQVDQVVKRHPEIQRARLVVEWIDESDQMTLHCESTDSSDAFKQSVANSVRELCKIRGEVALVELGSLPNDGLVISDQRQYD
ncbi:MAG: AMP-dependent synthetase [Proteobacteria bacterium]|nr:MAG: AMP-dependent synthetase [Pseudomonadota bacterium]